MTIEGTAEATTDQGTRSAQGLRFGIVASRFNDELTQALLDRAVECLLRHGADSQSIETVRVPGAFEIPLVIKQFASAQRFDALIALGVVIEGETPHADHIVTEVTRLLADLALQFNIPVIDGVVATRNAEQAVRRCKDDKASRGNHAAMAAIDMAYIMKEVAS